MSKTTITNTLSYKGYTGSVDINIEDRCLHGKILFIDDIITYEGDTIPDIETAFKGAVDRYMAHCKESGKPANKPYSGTFNVRIGPELHRKAAKAAHARNIKLNVFVAQAIKTATEQTGPIKIEHTHNHNINVASGETVGAIVGSMGPAKPMGETKWTH